MDAEFYFNRGVERSHKRDLTGAIEDYSIAISLTTGTIKKAITNTNPEGITETFNVIEVSEGNESMYFNRACAYLDLGNYSAAINDLTKFVEYNNTDGEVFFKRAIAHYCLENDYEAKEDLKLANSLNPQYNEEAFLAIFRH